uniref:DNA translocase FtsK n=1 Tax=Parastrongyloides trichosuri TaxID=131310 RepID=A0A0N4ZQI0_PARTI
MFTPGVSNTGPPVPVNAKECIPPGVSNTGPPTQVNAKEGIPPGVSNTGPSAQVNAKECIPSKVPISGKEVNSIKNTDNGKSTNTEKQKIVERIKSKVFLVILSSSLFFASILTVIFGFLYLSSLASHALTCGYNIYKKLDASEGELKRYGVLALTLYSGYTTNDIGVLKENRKYAEEIYKKFVKSPYNFEMLCKKMIQATRTIQTKPEGNIHNYESLPPNELTMFSWMAPHGNGAYKGFSNLIIISSIVCSIFCLAIVLSTAFQQKCKPIVNLLFLVGGGISGLFKVRKPKSTSSLESYEVESETSLNIQKLILCAITIIFAVFSIIYGLKYHDQLELHSFKCGFFIYEKYKDSISSNINKIKFVELSLYDYDKQDSEYYEDKYKKKVEKSKESIDKALEEYGKNFDGAFYDNNCERSLFEAKLFFKNDKKIDEINPKKINSEAKNMFKKIGVRDSIYFQLYYYLVIISCPLIIVTALASMLFAFLPPVSMISCMICLTKNLSALALGFKISMLMCIVFNYDTFVKWGMVIAFSLHVGEAIFLCLISYFR